MEILLAPGVAAVVAFTIYALNSRRSLKPLIVWHSEPNGPEWVEVKAVARRRPVEVREVGLEFRWGEGDGARNFKLPGPTSAALPHTYTDGQQIDTGFELGALIDELTQRIGEQARLASTMRPYVETSQKTYFGAIDADGWKQMVSRRWKARQVPTAR